MAAFKPKPRTVYEWTDLLFLGEEMGYGWNRTHDLMDFCNAKMWGDSTHGILFEELEHIYDEDANKIMTEFFKRVGNPEEVVFAA